MILVDGLSNGYRYHILPPAMEDATVQRAVCVASAFHLSVQRPELRLPAEAGRAVIIKKLKDKATTEEVFSIRTWATIILLFVGELITGSHDIIISYRMLMSFVSAKGIDLDNSPLSLFLDQQSRTIEFFTRPALSESDGVEELLAASSPENGDLEWPHLPAFTRRYYSEAYRQASAIYLMRAQSDFINLEDPLAIKLVARLKGLLIDVDQAQLAPIRWSGHILSRLPSLFLPSIECFSASVLSISGRPPIIAMSKSRLKLSSGSGPSEEKKDGLRCCQV
jgi:hypothetical protein